MEALEDPDYILNIKIPFKAIDDIAAREYANKIKVNEKAVAKLQRVYKDKPPVGIALVL